MPERKTQRDRDPDKTKPPTRVEDLWGGIPRRTSVAQGGRVRFVPRRRAESDGDPLALYRSARSCMSVGAYAEAAGLLRRLILSVAAGRGEDAATPERAQHLLSVAEVLLGLTDERDHSSNA